MKKGKVIGLLVGFVFIGSIAFGVNQVVKNPEKYQKSASSTVKNMTLKEFDSYSWDQYKDLYTAHNELMKAMTSYSEGKMNELNFFNFCEDIEKYFMQMSTSFDYGVNEDEKTYLSVLENWALFDQLATKSLIKYLGTLKTKDLSVAKKYIQSATGAAEMAAGNRSKLLKDAGYTKKEIKKIINSIPDELEKATKKK